MFFLKIPVDKKKKQQSGPWKSNNRYTCPIVFLFVELAKNVKKSSYTKI